MKRVHPPISSARKTSELMGSSNTAAPEPLTFTSPFTESSTATSLSLAAFAAAAFIVGPRTTWLPIPPSATRWKVEPPAGTSARLQRLPQASMTSVTCSTAAQASLRGRRGESHVLLDQTQQRAVGQMTDGKVDSGILPLRTHSTVQLMGRSALSLNPNSGSRRLRLYTDFESAAGLGVMPLAKSGPRNGPERPSVFCAAALVPPAFQPAWSPRPVDGPMLTIACAEQGQSGSCVPGWRCWLQVRVGEVGGRTAAARANGGAVR